MRLLILGATGRVGNQLLTQALAAGHDVTALVRDPARVSLAHPKLSVVAGSASRADELRKAVKGQDAVISTLGPRKSKDPICAQAAEALVAAMKEENVKRVVWTSASGVGDSAAAVTQASFFFGRIIMPLFLRHPYANHFKAEETLRASGLEWTVIRPLQLVDQPTGRPVVANLGDRKLEGLKIARQDVAAFMLDEAVASRHLRQTPMVHA